MTTPATTARPSGATTTAAAAGPEVLEPVDYEQLLPAAASFPEVYDNTYTAVGEERAFVVSLFGGVAEGVSSATPGCLDVSPFATDDPDVAVVIAADTESGSSVLVAVGPAAEDVGAIAERMEAECSAFRTTVDRPDTGVVDSEAANVVRSPLQLRGAGAVVELSTSSSFVDLPGLDSAGYTVLAQDSDVPTRTALMVVGRGQGEFTDLALLRSLAQEVLDYNGV